MINIVDYIPLAMKIVNGYTNKGIPYEDLKSAALTGLVKTKFKRGYSPATSIHLYVRTEITSLFVAQKTRINLNVAKGIDYRGDVFNEDKIIKSVDFGRLLEYIKTNYDERALDIIVKRLEGYTFKELSSIHGISHQRVDELERKIVKRLKKEFVR